MSLLLLAEIMMEFFNNAIYLIPNGNYLRALLTS